MKRERDEAVHRLVSMNAPSLGYLLQPEDIEPVIRDQQLAFGRRVLEDAARRMGIPGPFDDDDQRILEELADEVTP